MRAMTARLPLAEIRVLDLGGALSAYATKLLADFGADVLKVEPPEGDELRRRAPFRGEECSSLPFAYYHGNKRSVTLDVGKPASLPLLRELGEQCDVIVVTPTTDRPLTGLDPEGRTLDWAPGSAVVLALTPFGLTGPLAHWRMTPLTSFAMSGLMFKMGEPGRPPVTAPGQQAWDQAAVQGVLAVLAALRARDTWGGQLIDLSVHDYLSSQDDLVQRYSVGGVILTRGGSGGYPPTGVWDCLDGKVEFQVHTERHWSGFVDMLDHPAELSDPDLAGRLARTREADALTGAIDALLRTRSRYELVELGQARGVPCGLVNTPDQFESDPQMVDRGFFVDRADRRLGSIRVPGTPFRSSLPLTAFRRPAPDLGEHDEEVFVGELGQGHEQRAVWRRP
jgi:benzylsuccinate CoA-transferase BbsE subunit